MARALDADSVRQLREYAFKYFELHAAQRISVFNFYVVLASLFLTGIGASFDKTKDLRGIGIALGISLPAISFVFWKLDLRVKLLIKNSENTLKKLEQFLPDLSAADPAETYKLFSFEVKSTNQHRQANTGLWSRQFTYSECFNALFLFFSLLSGAAALMLFLS